MEVIRKFYTKNASAPGLKKLASPLQKIDTTKSIITVRKDLYPSEGMEQGPFVPVPWHHPTSRSPYGNRRSVSYRADGIFKKCPVATNTLLLAYSDTTKRGKQQSRGEESKGQKR